jgi:hypothetical protein
MTSPFKHGDQPEPEEFPEVSEEERKRLDELPDAGDERPGWCTGDAEWEDMVLEKARAKAKAAGAKGKRGKGKGAAPRNDAPPVGVTSRSFASPQDKSTASSTRPNSL